MSIELIFALISTLIYLVGAIYYGKDVFRGRTIPHPFSLGVWLILVGFNTYVFWINQQLYALIPSIVICISLALGVIFGIRNFKKVQINWFDYVCLILSGILLIYYFFSGDIFSTVIFTVIIDLIAFLPTFKKGWLQPWTETILIYLFEPINLLVALPTLSNPNFETTVFWGYLFFANLTFFFMVALRRYYLKGWNSIFD